MGEGREKKNNFPTIHLSFFFWRGWGMIVLPRLPSNSCLSHQRGWTTSINGLFGFGLILGMELVILRLPGRCPAAELYTRPLASMIYRDGMTIKQQVSVYNNQPSRLQSLFPGGKAPQLWPAEQQLSVFRRCVQPELQPEPWTRA